MTEGGTYPCGWSFADGSYRLWVADEPELAVVGPDFGEAADELASLIGERHGDGEAVLEFPGGTPADVAAGGLARARDLGYHESVRALNRSAEQFTGGICGHCGFGIGTRTDVSLEVSSLPKGHVAGVDRTLPWALLVSERLLDALTDEERARMRVQPVIGKGRGSFFELIGDPVARAVGVTGAEYVESFHRAWRCHTCPTRMLTIEHADYPADASFLSAEDVKLPLPSLFVYDHGYRLGIAVSETRWQELAGTAGTQGATTSPVFVVPAAIAVPEPDLPVPDEFDWF